MGRRFSIHFVRSSGSLLRDSPHQLANRRAVKYKRQLVNKCLVPASPRADQMLLKPSITHYETGFNHGYGLFHHSPPVSVGGASKNGDVSPYVTLKSSTSASRSPTMILTEPSATSASKKLLTKKAIHSSTTRKSGPHETPARRLSNKTVSPSQIRQKHCL